MRGTLETEQRCVLEKVNPLCCGLCWEPSSPSPQETSVHCTLLVIGVLQNDNPDFKIGPTRTKADKLHKWHVLQETPAISLPVGTTLALREYE